MIKCTDRALERKRQQGRKKEWGENKRTFGLRTEVILNGPDFVNKLGGRVSVESKIRLRKRHFWQ